MGMMTLVGEAAADECRGGMGALSTVRLGPHF